MERLCTTHRLGALFLVSALILAGCRKDEVKEDGTTVDVVPEAPVVDPSTYVCNPLDDGAGDQARDQGLLAHLFYIEPGGPQYSHTHEYIAFGSQAAVDLFFNQLYVPTRSFDRGFTTESGETLTAADGSTLYEWFGLRVQSQFQLPDTQPATRYQLAVLSDDGAVLKVGQAPDQRVLIDNDGWTPTRLKCASEPIEMQPGEPLPFELDYFQGPRFHIALVLLWRPWPASPADVAEPLCDAAGNSFWFDFTKSPSEPTARFQSLLARGWQVVPPQNFRLPEDQIYNPCNEPAPELSLVSVSEITTSSAVVTWNSDRPASTQVTYTEVASGLAVTTTLDPTLVLNHRVPLAGLKTNTQYSLRVTSKSASGRSTESLNLIFRTSR